MNDEIIKYIKQIKNDYGQEIFKDFKRTKSILDDYTKCKMQKEVYILIEALKQNAYFEFYNNPKKAKEIFIRIRDILCDNMAIKEDIAEWSIYVWADIAEVSLPNIKPKVNSTNNKKIPLHRTKLLNPKLSFSLKEILIFIFISFIVLLIIWISSYYTNILSNIYGLVLSILFSLIFIGFHIHCLLSKVKPAKHFHAYLFSYLMIFVGFFIFIAYFRIL